MESMISSEYGENRENYRNGFLVRRRTVAVGTEYIYLEEHNDTAYGYSITTYINPALIEWEILTILSSVEFVVH